MLGLEAPEFGHMTLIVNQSGKKLSKRDTEIVQFIEDYNKLGYLPEALFNFIALLGWSPEGTEEIFSKEELIKIFDVNRLSTSSAKFDVNKLSWINNQYIKKMDEQAYLDFVKPFLTKDTSGYTDAQIDAICLLYKDQMSYATEINELANLFFEGPILDAEALEFVNQEGVKNTLEIFKGIFANLDELTIDGIKDAIKETGVQAESKGKLLFMPIRIATTMQMHGPELPNTLVILGKEKVIKNIEEVISKIN